MKRLILLIGLLLLIGSVSATTSIYVSNYPPVQSGTYVKATSNSGGSYMEYFTTDPTKSLTGTPVNQGWQTATPTNQRFHIDLGAARSIERIYYENYHYTGGSTDRGAKDFTLWGSNTSGSFNNLTYANNTGWTQIGISQQYLDFHTGSDVVDPKYITLNSTQNYRYYAFKFDNSWGDLYNMGVRRIELQSAISWEYTTPGTYTWQCPTNITNISVQIVGGGSSGAPSQSPFGTYHGGTAGASLTLPIIAVVPGTNYSIVVGTGGTRANVGTSRNNGGLSSGFSYNVVGGSTTSNSVDGDKGFFSLTKFSEDGGCIGTCGLYPAGSGGSGYGAGGGGGGSITAPPYYSYGGAGAGGYILISNSSLYTGNVPAFSASTTTDFAGTQITFTDRSTIVNSTSLTYLWNFGDGTTSNTAGNTNHVYSYTGSYTVSLTLNNTAGATVTEQKNEYINIVTKPSTYMNPRTVSLICLDYWNNPIPGLTIDVTPINATIPDSWFAEYYGIGTGVTMTSTGFSGVTGTDGSWAAPMSESIRYNLSFSGAGIAPYYEIIYPVNEQYTIHIPTAGVYTTPTPASNYITYTLANATINSTYEFFNVTYQDTSGGSANLTLKVQNQNGTVLYTNTVAGFGTASTSISSGPIAHTVGDRYTYSLTAPQNQIGNVTVVQTIFWEATNAVGLTGFPTWTGNWIGIGLLVLLSATFSFISKRFAMIIIPIMAILMMVYMRWINPSVGSVAMLGSLIILLILGILMYIREGAIREGMA